MLPPRLFDPLFAPFRGAVPSASVLVMRGERVLLARSYGRADLEAGARATPRTRYRLASLTKGMVACASLVLHDRGVLPRETPLGEVLPGLPSFARAVRVRHVVSHLGGLPDYEPRVPPRRRRPIDDADVLAFVASAGAMLSRAGARFRYSNAGYVLLGLALERAAGAPLPALLRRLVFAPLGMGSALLPDGAPFARRAFGCSPAAEGGFARTDQSVTSGTRGDGGVYASLEDLAAWATFLRDPGLLLTPASRARMLEPARLANGRPAPYASGLRVGEYRGARELFHTGNTVGFRNVVRRFVDQDVTIAILTNRGDAPALALSHAVADAVLFGDPVRRV